MTTDNTTSEALARLAHELSGVGGRLQVISAELHRLRQSQPAPAPVQPPWQPQQAWHPQPLPPPLPPPVPRGPSLWERLTKDGGGSRVLAWAGGAVTLFGVVLLLVLAIQQGYLGPVPRVVLGAVLGVALAGIGMRLHTNPAGRTGAYALAATGTGALYLDVIAATALYGYLPGWAGLLAGLAVAAAGLTLAFRWNTQLLAVFVVVACAATAPILTEGFPPVLLGFLIVLGLATAPVQLAKGWTGLAVTVALTQLAGAVVAILLAKAHLGPAPVPTALLAVLITVVGLATATLTALRRPGVRVTARIVVAACVPGLLAMGLLERPVSILVPAILALLLFALALLSRTGTLRCGVDFAVAVGGMGAVAVFQTTATALQGGPRAGALLGEATVLAVVALAQRSKETLFAGFAFGVLGLLQTFSVIPLRYLFTAPRHAPLIGQLIVFAITGLVLLIATVAVMGAATRLGVVRHPGQEPQVWIGAAVVALYAAATAVLSIGLAISPDRTGFLIGHALVTVSWTIAALGLLVRGIDRQPLRVSGLVLVGAAIAKLVLFDLASLDGIARVAAFLGAGMVLLAAGTRYARLLAARPQAAQTPQQPNEPYAPVNDLRGN